MCKQNWLKNYMQTIAVKMFQLKELKRRGTWKIQTWTGIKPMTSAIPVQRSNQLSYQANWELVNWEFVFIP